MKGGNPKGGFWDDVVTYWEFGRIFRICIIGPYFICFIYSATVMYVGDPLNQRTPWESVTDEHAPVQSRCRITHTHTHPSKEVYTRYTFLYRVCVCVSESWARESLHKIE